MQIQKSEMGGMRMQCLLKGNNIFLNAEFGNLLKIVFLFVKNVLTCQRRTSNCYRESFIWKTDLCLILILRELHSDKTTIKQSKSNLWSRFDRLVVASFSVK